MPPTLYYRARCRRSRVVRRAVSTVLAVGWVMLGEAALADCCRVIKTDPETPSSTVRVCEVGPERSCGALLFAGTLTSGESHDVCAEGSTILYEELDPALGQYGPPVEARCEGGDVEL